MQNKFIVNKLLHFFRGNMRNSMLILMIIAASLSGQTMLATIEAPVETEFGTYVPLPVTIDPNALQVNLEEDLSNVINLSAFNLTESQISKLKANHFVVTPAVKSNESIHFNEMFDLYCEAREMEIPVFVTTDAMLHSYHLCFDNILKICEEKRFYSQLESLIDHMWMYTWDQYETATDTTVRKALYRNLDYLMVAWQLIAPHIYCTEPLPNGEYHNELDLIESSAGPVLSPIFASQGFNYLEDYSQYKSRGHYTKSDSLKRYFKAMMWLGRMTFSCEDTAAYNQTMTLSAILLTQAVSDIEIDGRPALDIWNDIYQPTVFFVGKSDDINFYPYLDIAYQIYGKSFPIVKPDTFGDQEKLMDFLNATMNLEGASITYSGQPDKGFRFMGQRFIPDSWILDELVMTKISGRTMPTGLDIMTVLGPNKQAVQEWAYQYVPEEDKANTSYVAKLDTFKQVFQLYPAEAWAQNAYWNWLYCLMPLLSEFGEGYPFFMQTDAWRDKDLFAALGSWAELRHDTILYAKQSGTETSIPPSAYLIQGYVEPNPHVFSRLASLANYMIEGLRNENLLFEEFQFALEDFALLSASLKTIAEKELTQTSLNADEYRLICDFGNRLFRIVTFNAYAEGPSPWNSDNMDPMPVVADVHTDFIYDMILEEAVGYPYAIYVVCNIEGQPVLTKGAGFSYYEFTRPISEGRLNDEEWREILNQKPHPEPPEWSQHFASGKDGAISAEYYDWRKPATTFISIGLSGYRLTTQDTLKIDIRTNIWNPEAPALSLQSPSGQNNTIQVNSVTDNHWQAIEILEQWAEGSYYLTTEIQALSYRTSFSITSGSSVNSKNLPRECHLLPACPNPFNPGTAIRYTLPEKMHTHLYVLNLRGQIVKELWNGSQPGGWYSIIWNGLNEQNLAVPSGVYLIRLQSENAVSTQKLTLIR